MGNSPSHTTRSSPLIDQAKCEADRLRRDVIPTLHRDLQPMAYHVLEIGMDVKRALVSVRRRREEHVKQRQKSRADAQDELKAFVHDSSDLEYNEGAITTRFTSMRNIAFALRETSVETAIASSPEQNCLNEALEVYRDAVIALENKAEDETSIPWDLRYFATTELDEQSGKMVLTLALGADEDDKLFAVEIGADADKYKDNERDICCLCGIMFQPGDIRHRCCDCRRTTTCPSCLDLVQALISKASDTLRNEVLHCYPHINHLQSEENNTERALWNAATTMSKTEQTDGEEIKVKMRNLFPRIFTVAYANRPCFGIPITTPKISSDHANALEEEDSTLKPISFKWFTYQTVWRYVSLLATELMGVLPPPQLFHERNEREHSPEIGIFSSATPTFFVLEFACVILGRICVGTDTTWRTEDVFAAMQAASVSTLLLDAVGYQILKDTKMALPKRINHIIVVASDPFEDKFTNIPVPSEQVWAPSEVKVDFIFTQSAWWNDTSSRAIQCITDLEAYTMSSHTLPGEDYVLGVFSSGTGASGYKGVMFRDDVLIKEVAETYFELPLTAATISSPSWSSGLEVCFKSVCIGGRLGFAIDRRGAPPWHYLAGIKPITWGVALVPALLTLLLEEHERKLAHLVKIIPTDIEQPEQLRKHEALARAKAAEHIHHCLGGATTVSLGGAMVNQLHVATLSQLLPCKILQTFGSTEGGGMGMSKHGDDFIKAMPNLQFRVESLPEFGYTLNDKPYPRGELLIQSDIMSRGEDWFGNDDAVVNQRKKYTCDGYYKTGDVVELRPGTNSFRIIDRVGNIVKQPNGLFFSPPQVEAAIRSLSRFGVSDFIVTATPQQGKVVLILEMERDTVSDEVKTQILTEAQKRCFQAGTHPSNIPCFVLADSEMPAPGSTHFWKEAGCYTPSDKLIRNKVTARFSTDLTAIDNGNHCGLIKGLPNSGCSDGIRETAKGLLKSVAILHHEDEDADLTTPLAKLGIDSVLWTVLRGHIKQLLIERSQTAMIPIPAFDLNAHSALDISTWMKNAIKTQNPPSNRLPVANAPSSSGSKLKSRGTSKTAKPKQGKERSMAYLDALEKSLFASLDQSLNESSGGATGLAQEKVCQQEAITVFLTGATGFLGRHILYALLSQSDSKRKVEVICLIRASSLDNACARLIDTLKRQLHSFESLKESNSEFISNMCGGIQVVVGSVDIPRLGLPVDEFDAVAARVDVIIHAAAVVKTCESLGNNEFWSTNSIGCIKIAQLAIAGGGSPSPILYISTASVESETLPPGRIIESLSEAHKTTKLRRDPYSMSKLLGESLLVRSSRTHRIPITILRPGFLTYSAGDGNENDWLTRLLRTVSETGLSPSKGKCQFLDHPVLFKPVAAFAEQVIAEVFSFATSSSDNRQMGASELKNGMPTGNSIVQCPKVFEDGEYFFVRNIMRNLKLVHHVPAFAFRAAVLSLKEPPTPFLPLVDWLIDTADAHDRAERTRELAVYGALQPHPKRIGHPVIDDGYYLPKALKEGLHSYIEMQGLNI